MLQAMFEAKFKGLREVFGDSEFREFVEDD